MPRKQTQDPLLGAAPSLIPTARPLAIPVGATPTPNRSPLMELAQAFDGFNGELRNLLRDAAAREERDAMALGELEAQKNNAATRMGEIEGVLKKAVDEGKVSHVRLPAFERGFRLRAGKDLAQSLFQEKLTGQLADATRVEGRVDPEKIIADTYAEISARIGPDDFYGRAAFDETAQGIMAGFRQRAAEGYTAEFQRAAEARMADEGSEYLFQLATAAEDDAPALRQTVKTHLDAIRNELPKSKVNEFFVRDVVAPAVQQLADSGKHEEARNILDEMELLDVTGKGGLLGQTSVAKSLFSTLRTQIDRDARYAENDAYERLNRQRITLKITGEDDAAKQLQQLRLGADGKLNPAERFAIIDAYRKANAGDPLKVQGFQDAVNREFDYEAKARTNERTISDLELFTNTLKKDQLEVGMARIDAAYEAGEIPPSVRTRLAEKVNQLTALYGAIDEGDFNAFKKDLYRSPVPFSGGDRSINFGDADALGNSPSATLWGTLPEDMRSQHEEEVTQFFGDALETEIRAIGDPNRVPAEKSKALDRATLKAREFARVRLRELDTQRVKDTQAAAVATQAHRIRTAAVVNLGAAVSPALGVGYDLPKGERESPASDRPPDRTKAWFKNNVRMPAPSLNSRPSPETEEVDVYIPAASFAEWILPGAAGTSRRVVMADLARDIKENTDDAQAEKSARLYSYVKGRLGFTPDEVKAGVTRDGVPFSPAAIDPGVTTVFRNRAELEKHWQNGKPDEVFTAVGDAIDPNDKMTPADFYLSQLAVFTAQKKR